MLLTRTLDWDLVRCGSDEPRRTSHVETLWVDLTGSLVLSRTREGDQFGFALEFADKLIVDLWPDRKLAIEHILQDGLPAETSAHFLDDQVVPRLMAHLGDIVLHGGAIRALGKAVVFIGESGRGKSTLCADFDSAGFPLMGDDALVLDDAPETPRIRAVYPSLRLLPDTIAALFENPLTAVSIGDYTDKQRIDRAPAGTHEHDALPLAAIFLLGPPAQDERIAVDAASPTDVCMAMITNSFELNPVDTARAASKLGRISVIANRVPAFHLRYPRNYALLPQVRDAILTAAFGLAGAATI